MEFSANRTHLQVVVVPHHLPTRVLGVDRNEGSALFLRLAAVPCHPVLLKERSALDIHQLQRLSRVGVLVVRNEGEVTRTDKDEIQQVGGEDVESPARIGGNERLVQHETSGNVVLSEGVVGVVEGGHAVSGIQVSFRLHRLRLKKPHQQRKVERHVVVHLPKEDGRHARVADEMVGEQHSQGQVVVGVCVVEHKEIVIVGSFTCQSPPLRIVILRESKEIGDVVLPSPQGGAFAKDITLAHGPVLRKDHQEQKGAGRAHGWGNEDRVGFSVGDDRILSLRTALIGVHGLEVRIEGLLHFRLPFDFVPSGNDFLKWNVCCQHIYSRLDDYGRIEYQTAPAGKREAAFNCTP